MRLLQCRDGGCRGVNSLWSDAGPLSTTLTPRLGAALAVSAMLHAALGASLQTPFGARWGSVEPGSSRALRATLRTVPPALPEQLPAAAPLPEAPPAAAPPPEPAVTPATPTRADAQAEAPPRAVLPESRYYRTRELDVPPGIMTRVEPEFPEAAARRMLSGKVVLRLFLAESGHVERAEVVKAEPPGHFESAAERAFLGARFSPGIKDGRPVKVQITLEIAFDSPSAPETFRR